MRILAVQAARRGGALVLAAALLALVVPVRGEAATRDVFLLSSYASGDAWTDLQVRGVSQRLSDAPYQARLWVEYLDTRRSPEAAAGFASYFRERHAGKRFDAIVTLDDAAAQYVLEHPELFGTKAPVVFGGVNGAELLARLPRQRFTGIFEDLRVGSIVEWARRLHPRQRRMILLADTSTTVTGLVTAFHEAERMDAALQIEEWRTDRMSRTELETWLRALGPESIVFLPPVTMLRDEPHLPVRELAAITARLSNGPVYGVGVDEMRLGLTAGTVNMGTEHGDTIGDLLLRVLNGEKPASIPVVHERTVRMVFDHGQMRRWGIGAASLPPGARVVNGPSGVLEVHGGWIAAAAAFLIVQSVIIGLLIANIHKRRTAQRALKESLAAAREAALVKSEFLANMSHELRTPMNGLLGMAQLLSDSPLNEEQRLYARTIHTCGESLLQLLNDVLEHSRLEAGKARFEPAPVAVREHVEDILRLMRPAAVQAGLALRMEAAADVPAHIEGDPHRIKQVLTNLVANAIKFTRAGSVTVRLSLSGEALRYEVEDTGIGIRQDDLEKIFERFRQVESTHSRNYGGAGLGLTISKQIVEAMGGRIGVASEFGRGTTFWFEIPLRTPATGGGIEAGPPEESLASLGAPLAGMNVLLVEDNAQNRLVIERTLGRCGCHMQCVQNGLTAVEAAARETFDAILMDVQLPGIDGLEATRRIRALPGGSSRSLILALTAFAYDEDRQRCVEAGVDGHIAKPVHLPALLRRMAAGRLAGEPKA